MIPDQYVWLAWAGLFLLPWLLLYAAFSEHRRAMCWASVFTSPFGLTEPLFVPEYWSPPSLFDLALRTGFDIESLIFAFGIGGVASVLYNVVAGRISTPVPQHERQSARHRYHGAALITPAVLFPALYFLPWNPIYPAIIAMMGGAISALFCRQDLLRKTWVGALLFVGYYAIFLGGLEWSAPGYIERVWNLDALSGVLILAMPLEELLFAFTFGLYWSSVYEHFTWRMSAGEDGRPLAVRRAARATNSRPMTSSSKR
jgi:hypothetical protein